MLSRIARRSAGRCGLYGGGYLPFKDNDSKDDGNEARRAETGRRASGQS